MQQPSLSLLNVCHSGYSVITILRTAVERFFVGRI